MNAEPTESLDELRGQLAEAMAAAVDGYRGSSRLIRLLTVIGQPSPPAQLVAEALRVLSEIFTADVACLTRPVGDRLLVDQACGLPEDSAAFRAGWPMAPAADEAIRTRRSVARADLASSEDLPPEIGRLDIQTAAWVPLATDRSSSGLLVLFRSSGEAFTAADLKMLDSVAYRLCVSIEAGERRLTIERLARIGHRLTRHLETDALLTEAAQQFRALAKADAVIVVTAGGERALACSRALADERHLQAWPGLGPALPGWSVLQRGRPFAVADLLAGSDPPPAALAADLHAYLAVPIMQDRRPRAVLCAFDATAGAFGPEAVEGATIFASYVAPAMVNAELYRALAQSASRLRLITDSISDMIALVARDGSFRYASPSYAREVGLDPGAMLGQHVADLVHPADRPRLEAALRTVDSSPKVEYRLGTGKGGWVWVETALRLGHSADDEIVLSSRVITERKAMEKELWQRATHDPMTGLANRELVRQQLEAALSSDATGSVGLLFCDLDNFKSVNDRLGHEAGDVLLRQVADRLRGCTRPGDLLARLGGDEFVVVLEGVAGLDEVDRVGQRVLTALASPFDLLGEPVVVSASVGGVLGPRGKTSAVHLLRDADAAMYAAKTNGRGRVAIFDEHAARRSLERLGLRSEVDRALENGELSLSYQPIVRLDSGSLVGFEALARWANPRRGSIPPATFIPLAEETGAIVPIGRWAMAEACRQLGVWNAARPGPRLTIGVNVSSLQLEAPGFAAETLAAVAAAGMDAADLSLEVTENRIVRDAALGELRALRAAGVKIALDDFGISQSNLSHLDRFPIDALKIDRSFIAGIADDKVRRGIVLALLALSDSLDLAVVAEGIETRAQWQALLAAGCWVGQGYLFSRPLPADRAGEVAALGLRRGLRQGPLTGPLMGPLMGPLPDPLSPAASRTARRRRRAPAGGAQPVSLHGSALRRSAAGRKGVEP